MAIDFDLINKSILSSYKSIITDWIPGGNFEGDQYVVCSPFREDKNPGSFKINTSTGVYKDFNDAAVSGADPINLYAMLNGLSQGDAAKELAEKYSTGQALTPSPKKDIKIWKTISPVPKDAPAPPKTHIRREGKTWVERKINSYYPYHDVAGNLIGYTCRIVFANDRKDILPLTYCTDGTEKAWRFKSFNRPRPIYGLDALANNLQAQVLVVEGEKCKDAATKILKEYFESIVPIAWIGGGKGAKYINWNPLKGRKVIFWPDADSQTKGGKRLSFVDQPGPSTMIQIYNLIKSEISGGRLISPPHEWTNGKDIADLKGWDAEKVLRFISENIITFESISQKPSADKIVKSAPFQCLGYNSYQGNVTYYYLPVGTRKVTALSPGNHSKMSLLSIAPVQYYEREYSKSSGADFMAAANDCMRQNEAIGIYDPLRVRGRGAWFDAGRTVLHLGDRLIVDGETCKVDEIKSHYIYEAEIPTELSSDFMADEMEDKESRVVLDICKLLSWEHNIHAALFAGWLMLAPICGAIDWRPHIWLTGESSTGKSWTLENVVAPILGNTMLSPMSNSTEAGVRQLLKNDAFPIKFDEIETEDREAAVRVQRIIELARQSSNNKSGAIIKGTITGRALTYCVRSCFLFSSVNPQIKQQADESRIKMLNLVKRDDYISGSKFDKLSKMVIDTLTNDYCRRFRARAIKLIPTIRSNAEIFSRVVSKSLRSRRGGDQIGTLLAGAYNIKNSNTVKESLALEYVESIDWDNDSIGQPKSDQDRLVELILQQLIKTNGNNTEAIGSLLRKAGRDPVDNFGAEALRIQVEHDRQESRHFLRKYGITTITDRERGSYDIGFADNHSQLMGLLQETPWRNGYKNILIRYDGAYKKTAVYADKMRSQSVCIPYKNIFPQDIDEDQDYIY